MTPRQQAKANLARAVERNDTRRIHESREALKAATTAELVSVTKRKPLWKRVLGR